MVIAITGHTAGIGKILYDHYSATHKVLGYSRANGYDLTIPSQVVNIISDVSEKADVFINNAYTPENRGAQLELLEGIYKNWKERAKIIIVNSSLSPIYEKWYPPKEKMKEYSKSKRALTEQCEKYLWEPAQCRVIDIKLGLVETELARNFAVAKMNAAQLIPYFDFAIKNTLLREMTVQCLC